MLRVAADECFGIIETRETVLRYVQGAARLHITHLRLNDPRI